MLLPPLLSLLVLLPRLLLSLHVLLPLHVLCIGASHGMLIKRRSPLAAWTLCLCRWARRSMLRPRPGEGSPTRTPQVTDWVT